MPHFSKLILTIGIPGSGKTRWVNKYVKKHPLTHVISTDALRKELTGTEICIDPSQSGWIHEQARQRAKAILDDPNNYSPYTLGPEIIIDSTNVELEEWIAYKNLGATLMLAKIFDVEPKEAIKRMDNRDRKVPLEILEMKWKKLESNREKTPKLFNMIIRNYFSLYPSFSVGLLFYGLSLNNRDKQYLIDI